PAHRLSPLPLPDALPISRFRGPWPALFSETAAVPLLSAPADLAQTKKGNNGPAKWVQLRPTEPQKDGSDGWNDEDGLWPVRRPEDRKSTRLNSSHEWISY